MADVISAIRVSLDTLDWRAAVDIGVVAALVFFLYHSVRATGAGKVIVGLLLGMAVFVTASVLDLRGIEWIYSNLSQVALVGLIVIFQPEIRRVLESAASLQRAAVPDAASPLADTLSRAVFALAAQRRGALVVIPGKRRLAGWISAGVRLGAEPSVPLLLSLFDPHSPGHDGAIVFEQGRVAAFAVKLPLSKSGKLPAEMGTRHHAGLGLAEATDALAVAVSEERGTVTAFADGGWEVIADAAALSGRLRAHWERTSSYGLVRSQGAGARTLARELAVSLVVATAFWSAVAIGRDEVREEPFVAPVDFVRVPGELAVDSSVSEVRLYLAGPAADLERVDPRRLQVSIDLARAAAGRQTVLISEEALNLPRRVSLARAEPPSLDLVLAERKWEELEVKPQLVGSVPDGFVLGQVVTVPARVRASVPAGVLDVPSQLTTTPIYLDHIRRDSRVMCKVIAPAGVETPGGSWPDVEVHISVRRSGG